MSRYRDVIDGIRIYDPRVEMNRDSAVTESYRKWREIPFKWGKADCLSFAGEVARKITGRNPASKLKRRYSSEKGAKRVMVKEGWRNMGDVAAALLPELPPARAATGDWAHVTDEHGHDCIGVVSGHLVAIRTEDGMSQVPIEQAKRIFRVG